MLQKVLVVIVGLVMSVVGALSPDGMFASNNGEDAAKFSGTTIEETLSTLRTSDGRAFARVSVLWVEVDGRRVTEDAWGTGQVDEIRFKVGVKDVDDAAIAVGDKIVDLHPTDIITVRMFRGDFSYRGLGTPLAGVQLQGTVKTTVREEGGVSNRVLTQTGELDLSGVNAGSPRDDSKVAYVVLTTGQKVDTVAIEDGGSRFFTQEAPTANTAKPEPGNLLAKWVKIDGQLVREYTWGDGVIKRMEFSPAEGVTRSVVVTFNGEVSEVAAGERVVIDDFVGEYLVYQVSGGMMRVRLDGYAASYGTAASLTVPTIGGVGAPLASFNFTPVSPRTTDTVQFRDESRDADGIIVFQQWDFGDNTSAVIPNPTHRYARPGAYDVTLSVTDNDLHVSNMTRTIIVRNADPVPDFDYSPKIITTDTVVSFSNMSFDSDGRIVSATWDLGDGTVTSATRPTHRFTRGGEVTVTFTVVDDLGGTASISKVLLVRNAPPQAGFAFNTSDDSPPVTLTPIRFFDNSTDRDGTVVRWNWSFGDGTFGSGSAPVHAYARPGAFTVSLTVTDDGNDSATVSTNIIVQNRAPFAEFTWTPDGEPANVPITFTSTSTDPDGVILLTRWDFGDGRPDVRGPTVTHQFPRAGTYNVTLTVTDNTVGTSTVTREVTVGNSAPRANFRMSPSPSFRGVTMTFTDSSSDPDGDALVNWTWDLGDGAVRFGRVVQHVYNTTDVVTVTLTVEDDQGQRSSVSRPHRILNRPPTTSADYTPRPPTAGENVTFRGYGVDPDMPSANVSFEWKFSDGVVAQGDIVVRNFTRAGNYSVSIVGRDVDGGVSSPNILSIVVIPATPRVNFTFAPTIPLVNQLVNFTDLSVSPNGAIRSWRWDFGESATSLSDRPSPSFAFTRNGTFRVTLEVTDVVGMMNSTSKDIFVNLPPSARFTLPSITRINEQVSFTDASVDDDGAVVNWTWTFGDGNMSYVRHPTNVFTTPGTYAVNLTVRDDLNATDRMTKIVDIASSPPLARWNHSTLGLPQERGVPVYFYGGELSTDPDGQPLTSFAWNFGDGSPPANVANTSHAFGHSGFHTVGLVVSDGAKLSPRTTDSHQTLRLGANHAVTLRLTASLPGGAIAPISGPDYNIGVTLGGVPLLAPAYAANGTGVDVTIDKELWLHGANSIIRITAPFLVGPNERTVRLDDDVHVIPVHFTLRMGTKALITPYGGVNDPITAMLLGKDSNFSDAPLYHDVFEKPYGTGLLQYSNNISAPFAKADVEARYVPLNVVSPLRQTIANADTTNNALIGWCKVDEATTYSNGTFDWEFDGTSICYTNSINGGLYPVGRWEVRARTQVADAENSISPVKVFYVDPTGGILLRALSGLA